MGLDGLIKWLHSLKFVILCKLGSVRVDHALSSGILHDFAFLRTMHQYLGQDYLGNAMDQNVNPPSASTPGSPRMLLSIALWPS
jgi:hypothetical protein